MICRPQLKPTCHYTGSRKRGDVFVRVETATNQAKVPRLQSTVAPLIDKPQSRYMRMCHPESLVRAARAKLSRHS